MNTRSRKRVAQRQAAIAAIHAEARQPDDKSSEQRHLDAGAARLADQAAAGTASKSAA
jgi:hypothetical protein